MKRWIGFLSLWLLLVAPVAGEPAAVIRASMLEAQGRFLAASNTLYTAAANFALSAAERRRLAFELDRLERIRKDYPFTQASLFKRLQDAVRDLTESEFETWVAKGWFDARDFDGERRYMSASISNLFFRHPELNPRRLPLRDTSKHDQASLATCRAIRKAARQEGRPYVLPKRLNAVMTVTVDADAVPDGEVVCAWLPIPREYPFQQGFALLNTSSPVRHLDGADSPIRSVYLEQKAQAGTPTRFSIEYEYKISGVSFDINPERVRRVDALDPALKPFLREELHVAFTPEMRALSKKILGDETNPARQAKRIYDWIAEHIQYSYALEYSTIRNISDYCRDKSYGDCGQEALLFITLCRLNGIPARWQSGWNLFPGVKGIHDWCEMYLAPYGWMPVDPYKGIFAMQYAPTLTPEEKHEVRDFYFGGLDYYRMAANSAHSQVLTPPKQSFRSDTVDFQRGEVEWGTNNLYFDEYSYGLQIREVPTP